MCGIAGIVGEEDYRVSTPVVGLMLSALNRRGPDGRGLRCWGGATLGSCRLSIFDLTCAGQQPMVSECKQVGLVFNGAIYNFKELRRELEGQGHRFRSQTDTEVLLEGYREWGMNELLSRIRGMFAIALWDNANETLFLARDRLGVKPLYYTIQGGRIAFASTARALRVAGLADDIDPLGVAEFLEFGYVTDGRSIYQNVAKVAGAHLVQWSKGYVRDTEYWAPPAVLETAPRFEEAVQETERLLLRAVEARLAADVPVGALLSGGVDSSLVCWAVSKLGGDLNVFTVAVSGESVDESADAAETARELGLRHHVLNVSSLRIPNLDELSAAFPEPFACESALGLLAISRVVKPEATVLLTGDGGDEVFLGYPTHRRLLMAQRLATVLPETASRSWYPARRMMTSSKQLKRLMHLLDFASGGLGAVTNAHDGWPMYQQTGMLGERLVAAELWQRHINWSPIAGKRVLADWMEYHRHGMFVGEFMTKVDGATMHHSLEARSPFLDQELWEFGAKLPYHLRLRNGTPKAVLRELAKRHCGKRVANGKKRGFRIPVQRWLVGRWLDAVRETFRSSLLEEGGWIQGDAVRRELERAAIQHSAPQQIWYLYVLESWLRYEAGARDHTPQVAVATPELARRSPRLAPIER
jgi:asparagine synthase (glutamine-hydrolysing)